jgi:uncharacterized membrane protein/glutaredoxin
MMAAARALPLALLLVSSLARPAAQPLSVAQAVLFYTPTCPYCHKVMTEDLPPLMRSYGIQLEILAADTATARGQALYQAAAEAFQIPQDRIGVPTLIIGQEVLVGAVEIPERFPGLVQAGLDRGGVPFPAFPGYGPYADQFPRFTAEGVVGSTGESVVDRVGRDPLGNGLAIAMLAGMLASLYLVSTRVRAFRRRPRTLRKREEAGSQANRVRWIVPLLASAGLLISAYLTYVGLSHAEAVCGPVGDCDAVQGSTYARFFGVPVSMIGLFGYGAILIAWALARFGHGPAAAQAAGWLLPLSVAGTLFSIYLTFLEPFVIGAACSWCLVSAGLITGLMWSSAGPAVALSRGQPSRA